MPHFSVVVPYSDDELAPVVAFLSLRTAPDVERYLVALCRRQIHQAVEADLENQAAQVKTFYLETTPQVRTQFRNLLPEERR